MTDKYVLRVTAGADYDDTQQVIVPVNQTRPVCIEGKKAKIELNVRIQDFHGLPPGSPVSSPYFSAEPHASNGDQYSISFRFTPLSPVPSGAEAFSGKSDDNDREPVGIKGTDLLFGNDFDHPIRDRLPPGFNTAMSIVQWWIDPGLEGDAYADQPYLYGPALSSFNSMHVGRGTYDESKGGLCFDEGGDEDGLRVRDELQLPIDSKARMKWALQIDNKSKWTFEYGQTYCFDFFNSYLDFTNLAVRLPGFHLPILRYWDGQALRYVLKNKTTNETYMVVLFTIHLKEDVNEDGTLKDSHPKQHSAEDAEQGAVGHEGNSEILASSSEIRNTSDVSQLPQTTPDDVD